MDKEPKTSDLSPEKLARLWDVGSDVQADDTGRADERQAELLRDWLARSLPPDESVREVLPEEIDLVCRELQPFSGESIGQLITYPETDVQVLKRIKDCAKDCGATTQCKAQREAALGIYFAAIASAMVFHNAKLSQHSDARLKKAFETWAERSWLPGEVKELFANARATLEKRAGTTPAGRG